MLEPMVICNTSPFRQRNSMHRDGTITMRISSIGCTRYKAFKQETKIELRPLTLFFGKNNSGKTVLLRLPRLLLRALSTRTRREFPVQVDELTFGETFRDLIHGGLPHGSASFYIVLNAESETLDLSAEVQNIQDPRSRKVAEYHVVSRFRLVDPAVDWEWEPGSNAIVSYRGVGPVSFRGLLPDIKEKDASQYRENFETWRERVQTFEDSLTHLGPLRSSVERVYESGGEKLLGFDGAGAPNWLANNAQLLRRTAAWYAEYLDGWKLSLDYAGSAFQCMLSRGAVTVNLADAGQGMQQTLPVVVQQLARQLDDGEPFFDLVEQPELHLHAAAQAPLGDLFLGTAVTGRGQVLVETHSENLLLRIRRRIAEGVIDPGLIALYWVGEHPEGYSSVRRIELLEDGEVDWWPEGIFSEDYEEVRFMRRAARMRSRREETL